MHEQVRQSGEKRRHLDKNHTPTAWRRHFASWWFKINSINCRTIIKRCSLCTSVKSKINYMHLKTLHDTLVKRRDQTVSKHLNAVFNSILFSISNMYIVSNLTWIRVVVTNWTKLLLAVYQKKNLRRIIAKKNLWVNYGSDGNAVWRHN